VNLGICGICPINGMEKAGKGGVALKLTGALPVPDAVVEPAGEALLAITVG
jgi:hypothetical protein